MANTWQAIGNAARETFDFLLRAVAFGVVAFQNWEQTLDAIPDGLFALVTVGWGHLEWLWDNIKLFADWFGNNFQEMFKNLAVNIGTILGTIAGEFSNLWDAIEHKIANPGSKFRFSLSNALTDLGNMQLVPLAASGPQFKERLFSDDENAAWNRAATGFAPLNQAANELAGQWKDALLGAFGGAAGEGAAGAGNGGGLITDPEGGPLPPGVAAGKTFGTFSAAAAMLATGRNNPQEHANKLLENIKKANQLQLAKQEEMVKLLRDRGLAFD